MDVYARTASIEVLIANFGADFGTCAISCIQTYLDAGCDVRFRAQSGPSSIGIRTAVVPNVWPSCYFYWTLIVRSRILVAV